MYSLASDPVSLLLHDGELADVRRILEELDGPFIERLGSATREDSRTPWSLVVGSPKRLLDMDLGELSTPPTRIAVVEGASRTLSTMLRRIGVAFIVQRPVHPAVLRLLIVHALYQCEEKRRKPRVVVGCPVRFRNGLRRRLGLLAELSPEGARILTRHRVRPGSRITLFLPADSSRHALTLRGQVVREERRESGSSFTHALALAFVEPSPDLRTRLKGFIAEHADGPKPVPPELAAELSPAATDDGEGRERRLSTRRSLDRKIMACHDDEPTILLARDISLGGLRVDRHPKLHVGDKLQIALHVGSENAPVTLWADVNRDDGEHGFLLRFQNISREELLALREMQQRMAVYEPGPEEGDAVGLIVSEVLEHETGPSSSGADPALDQR